MSESSDSLLRPVSPDGLSRSYAAFLRSIRLVHHAGTLEWTDNAGSQRWTLQGDASGLPVLARIVDVTTARFVLPNYEIPDRYLLLVDGSNAVLQCLAHASTTAGADCTFDELDRCWTESALAGLSELGVPIIRVECHDVLSMARAFPGPVPKWRAALTSRAALHTSWAALCMILVIAILWTR